MISEKVISQNLSEILSVVIVSTQNLQYCNSSFTWSNFTKKEFPKSSVICEILISIFLYKTISNVKGYPSELQELHISRKSCHRVLENYVWQSWNQFLQNVIGGTMYLRMSSKEFLLAYSTRPKNHAIKF